MSIKVTTFDCHNLTAIGAWYRVERALWPVVVTDHLVGGCEVAVLAKEVPFGTLVGEVGGEMAFLNWLLTLVWALDINILTVVRIHVQVSIELFESASPITASILHHTSDLEG